MTITLHDIPNCDTVKKARTWFESNGVAYTFHDFKKQGVTDSMLRSWIASVGWEKLVNKQGTTWRKLPPEQQATVIDADGAVALMMAQPSVIKRPVVVAGSNVVVGLDIGAYEHFNI